MSARKSTTTTQRFTVTLTTETGNVPWTSQEIEDALRAKYPSVFSAWGNTTVTVTERATRKAGAR